MMRNTERPGHTSDAKSAQTIGGFAQAKLDQMKPNRLWSAQIENNSVLWWYHVVIIRGLRRGNSIKFIMSLYERVSASSLASFSAYLTAAFLLLLAPGVRCYVTPPNRTFQHSRLLSAGPHLVAEVVILCSSKPGSLGKALGPVHKYCKCGSSVGLSCRLAVHLMSPSLHRGSLDRNIAAYLGAIAMPPVSAVAAWA
jgi:hypothetical protein